MSASRIASMNWPWNSLAMRFILPTNWPAWRSTRGRSFGGMKISAMIPTIMSFEASKSNMAAVSRCGQPTLRGSEVSCATGSCG